MKKECLNFLLFSSFLLFCSSPVFSQNKSWQQTLPTKLHLGILKVKPITKHEAIFIETQIDEQWKDSVLKRYIKTEILMTGNPETDTPIDSSQIKAVGTVSEKLPKPDNTNGEIHKRNVFLNEIEKPVELRSGNQSRSDLLKNPGRGISLFSHIEKLPIAVSFENPQDVPENSQQSDPTKQPEEGFQWRTAIKQSLLFLSIQHGYAFTQAKTRRELKGNFFKDYIKSVKSLHGWDDGGRFFTNYIAHPMQVSFTGFIQIHNDPKGRKQRFGASGYYWRSRLKALAWSAAWSTQFEIGPISQASIGNVGLHGKQTYVDLVMTPTAGTALLITEDALDRFLIERIERRTDNYYIMVFSRMLLNPTRTIANLFRFKLPWYRDRARVR